MQNCFVDVNGVSRAKIEEVTLNALRTRQSLVKGERLVRHEMRAVLLRDRMPRWLPGLRAADSGVQ